ncbi:MAG: hypothetical protein ABFE08_13685 [Armatimonadia bacterium]
MDLPGRGRRRLYYYQGNFFHPVDLVGAEPGLVKRGIREFMKEHRALVETDRADTAYKTLMQLADVQPE